MSTRRSSKPTAQLIERYKARLVVQGFNQRLGLHYQADNVESPTVHAPTFKGLVAMATQLNLAVVQWDVANAFIQGDIKDGGELYPPARVYGREHL